MVQAILGKLPYSSFFDISQKAIAQNLASTYEEIKVAESFIKRCINYKKKEIIFKETTPKFLFALNIHNADQAYRS